MKPNLQIWDIEKLIPYEKNSKIHDKAQVSKIAQSIKEFGWTQPIVVDKSGVIIAGHGRRLAALSLDQKQVPVWVRDDLDEQQVRALRLVDNRVAEARMDTEMFRLELSTLDFNLEGMFDAKELAFAAADLGEIDLSSFVDNMSEAVQRQDEESAEAAESVKQQQVAIHKVFGFKTILGGNQITVTRFMSLAEQKTGLKGEAALVEFMKGLLSE